MTCPLCHSLDNSIIRSELGHFSQCCACHLVYRTKEEHLDLNLEKERYSLHENNLTDHKYLDYLNQLLIHLLPHLEKGHTGCDFGCGPTKGIEHILKKKGLKCFSYDPLYFPSSISNLGKEDLNFITCCEAIEHFFNPRKELDLIFSSLKSNGILAIRTEFVTTNTNFDTWYYAKDPTHVAFYSDQTFSWIEEHWEWTLLKGSPKDNRFVCLKKNI